jgi:hypothetical protein
MAKVSLMPYPTSGQLLIQELSHIQMIIRWCPILMEEYIARKFLLQLVA